MKDQTFDPDLNAADVYKMADVLMRRHGKDAVIIASMRAGELLRDGDMDGYRTWKRLIMLVDGMTDQETADHASLH